MMLCTEKVLNKEVLTHFGGSLLQEQPLVSDKEKEVDMQWNSGDTFHKGEKQ